MSLAFTRQGASIRFIDSRKDFPGMDEDQIEEMQFAFMDAVDEMAKKSKENIVTSQTIDYVVWADASKYDKSSKVYRAIKSAFKDIGVDGNLKQININRKLILLKVVYE